MWRDSSTKWMVNDVSFVSFSFCCLFLFLQLPNMSHLCFSSVHDVGQPNKPCSLSSVVRISSTKYLLNKYKPCEIILLSTD